MSLLDFLFLSVMDVFGKAALALANADNSAGTVPAPRLHEALHAAVDSSTEFGDRGIEFCSQSLGAALAKLTSVATAIQNGEFDFDGSREEKAVPPILLRAEEVKAEIREATGTSTGGGTSLHPGVHDRKELFVLGNSFFCPEKNSMSDFLLACPLLLIPTHSTLFVPYSSYPQYRIPLVNHGLQGI